MQKVETSLDLRTVPYSDAYKEKAFVAWYSAGCPTGERFALCLPTDENGRVVQADVAKKWIRDFGWRDRANALNEEVARQIERRAVEVRVEMLNRQAEAGKLLQEKGLKYLDEHEFEKAGEALKAVISGAELERASRGLPDALLKVAEMKDEDLSKVLSNLLGKVGSDQIEKVLAFDVEAEFTDAPNPTEAESE